MLKQPDRLVIYPQKDSKPDYLLCWIPPSNFGFVSGGSAETEAELEAYYPDGIEVEFTQDGLDEYGISLPDSYDLDALRKAFMYLNEIKCFEEVNFINLKGLQKYVLEQDDKEIKNLLEKFADGKIKLDDLKKNEILRRLLEEPKSKGKEDPGEAFQRLSGKLEPDDG